MARIIALLFLLSCSTDKGVLNSPPDTKQAIKDLSEIQVAPTDIAKKERIIRTLQDCGSYSLEAYDRYIQCTADASTLRTRIISLEKELASLREELQTWRYIKYGFYLLIGLYMLYTLARIYLKYKPI